MKNEEDKKVEFIEENLVELNAFYYGNVSRTDDEDDNFENWLYAHTPAELKTLIENND